MICRMQTGCRAHGGTKLDKFYNEEGKLFSGHALQSHLTAFMSNNPTVLLRLSAGWTL